MRKSLLILTVTAVLLLTSCVASELPMIDPSLTTKVSNSTDSADTLPEPVTPESSDLIGAWVLTESRIGTTSLTVGFNEQSVRVFAEDGTMKEYLRNKDGAFELVASVKCEYTLTEGVLTVLSFLDTTVEQFRLDNPDLVLGLTDEEIISKYIDLGSVEYSAYLEGEKLVLSLTLEGIGSFSYVYSPYTEELDAALPTETDIDAEN